ncbi:MAG: virulence factor [Stagnimonas sp.]|nr:virulence factor [Stagnimonas sp.]
MFAIAFDLVVADTEREHPKGVCEAYSEIAATLAEYDFRLVHGSLYVAESEDRTKLFAAINALKGKAWFRAAVRDIRAFRIEQWSDFTADIKQG